MTAPACVEPWEVRTLRPLTIVRVIVHLFVHTLATVSTTVAVGSCCLYCGASTLLHHKAAFSSCISALLQRSKLHTIWLHLYCRQTANCFSVCGCSSVTTITSSFFMISAQPMQLIIDIKTEKIWSLKGGLLLSLILPYQRRQHRKNSPSRITKWRSNLIIQPRDICTDPSRPDYKVLFLHHSWHCPGCKAPQLGLGWNASLGHGWKCLRETLVQAARSSCDCIK